MNEDLAETYLRQELDRQMAAFYEVFGDGEMSAPVQREEAPKMSGSKSGSRWVFTGGLWPDRSGPHKCHYASDYLPTYRCVVCGTSVALALDPSGTTLAQSPRFFNPSTLGPDEIPVVIQHGARGGTRTRTV